MSSETPKRIEELLRNHAKQRREQAGDPSLHAATRRLLQGEVTRQFARRGGGKGWLSWLAVSPFRMAMGGAAAAIVAISGWIVLSEHEPSATKFEKDYAQAPPSDERLGAEKNLREEDVSLKPDAGFMAASEPAALGIAPALRSQAEQAETLSLAMAPSFEKARQDNGVTANYFSFGRAPATNSLAPLTLMNEAGGIPTNITLAFSAPPVATPRVSESRERFSDFAALGGELRPFAPAKVPQPGGDYGLAQRDSRADGARSLSVDDRAAVVSDTTVLTGQVTLAAALPRMKQEQELRKTLAYDVTKADDGAAALDSPAQAASGLGSLKQPSLAQALAKDREREVASTTSLVEKTKVDGIAEKETLDSVSQQDRDGQLALVRASDAFYRQENLQRSPAQTAQENAPADKKSELSRSSQVLSSFTIEERGNTVRIVDADESVYEGEIQVEAGKPAVPLEDNISRFNGLSREAKATAEQRARYFLFRAKGTNRTLQQVVVVNGRFSGEAQVQQLTQSPGGIAGGAAGPVGAASGEKLSEQAVRSRGVARRVQQPAPGAAAPQGTNATAVIEGTMRIGNLPEQNFKALRGVR